MLTNADLSASYRSDTWYRHSNSTIYSKGVQHVIEKGEAYWLIDAITSHETHNSDLLEACKNENFDFLHFWKLTVDTENRTGTLICYEDTGKPAIVTQEIPFTDFPLSEIIIYAGNDGPGTPRKLFMPSEW